MDPDADGLALAARGEDPHLPLAHLLLCRYRVPRQYLLDLERKTDEARGPLC